MLCYYHSYMGKLITLALACAACPQFLSIPSPPGTGTLNLSLVHGGMVTPECATFQWAIMLDLQCTVGMGFLGQSGHSIGTLQHGLALDSLAAGPIV